jgi:two-component system, cell cycle sensor histidine kinase and response regulator CckA
VINGYSEMAMAKYSTMEGLLPMLAEIRRAGEHAASLTRQLLAFSRKQVLTPQIVDVNAVVGNLEKMLKRLIGEDILITTIRRPDVLRIRVDPGQLEQILINLVVNSRDAMPRGGRVTIETENVMLMEEQVLPDRDLRPGPHVALSVSDSGCGMAPEVLSHIFEPFFTTKETGQGTGLGLATVFGIVKQSGGAIDVSSELNKGTRFRILFPAVADEDSVPERPEVNPRRGHETLLLVEDEAGVRGIARLALESQGYRVLEASRGRQTLEIFQQSGKEIQLVVTDVVMPEMSGRELVEMLRAGRPHLGVLYISGHTDDAVVRHGVLEATDAFLQKPFSPLELAAKVRETLDRPRREIEFG